jgi:hypothetical protein
MDKLAPANLKSEELPAGFSSADPNNAASGVDAEARGEDEQKQAILQQALTPDALARLRRIKVWIYVWFRSTCCSENEASLHRFISPCPASILACKARKGHQNRKSDCVDGSGRKASRAYQRRENN